MKTTLTTAESQRLIELGIDENLASSCELIDVTDESDPNSFLDIEEHRIFTLTDLLTILPKEIEKDDEAFALHTKWGIEGDFSSNHQWLVFYSDGFLVEGDRSAPELIDALYFILIWTIEHGHLNGNGNEE